MNGTELQVMEKSPFIIKGEKESIKLKDSIGKLLEKSNFNIDTFKTVFMRAPKQINGYLADKVANTITNNVPKLKKISISKVRVDEFEVKFNQEITRIETPVKLEDYEGEIPSKILDRIHKFESSDVVKDSGLVNDFELDYYVADVVRDPDPILFVQLRKMKELTFFIGGWE
jgi:hypothetical protein